MHRRGVRLALVLLSVGAGGSVGCDEEYSDDKRGVLDLTAVHDRSGSRNSALDPDLVPTQINAQTAYVDGQVAELYDFGPLPTVQDPGTGAPVAVRVQPMYFFYDENDRPLFSAPVRELRDGTDWIKGGQAVRSPNPKDFCAGVPAEDQAAQAACKERNAIDGKKPYPLRQRDLVTDPNRGGSADYQRPVVDLSPQDNRPPRSQYTGFWEVFEVKAPNSYKPDAIKTVSTLRKAIDSGKFKVRSTGKVINCPIIDERTNVSRGITNRRIFRPRIELWYRGLLATCFLANGWETLGTPAGAPLFAGIDSDRLDTFDVARISLGSGPAASRDLVVPIARAYAPALISDDQSGETEPTITRVANNLVGTAAPRRTSADVGGYSPAQWLFDVPAASNYESGAWKSVKDFDLSTAFSRIGDNGGAYVANISVRGVAQRCSFMPEEFETPTKRKVQRCGRKVQDPNKPAGNLIYDATGDPTCNAERDPLNPKDLPLECNSDTCFCDAPIVKYGQACGPGLARCATEKDNFSEFGYECFPPWGGFCQKSCGGGNELAERNMGAQDLTKYVDSRCYGVPGFLCYPGLATCIKICDQNVTDADQCKVEVMVGTEKRDIQAGQTCQDFGLHVCAWPDSYTPTEFAVPAMPTPQ